AAHRAGLPGRPRPTVRRGHQRDPEDGRGPGRVRPRGRARGRRTPGTEGGSRMTTPTPPHAEHSNSGQPAAPSGTSGGEHAGKIAVITGASRGIGRTLALMLGAQGATVVVNYRSNTELAEEVVAEVTELGGAGLAVQADVENPEDIVRLFDTV